MSETINTATNRMGFFGKLPSHGDFVSRRMPRSFTDPWDNWLQTVIANSREQLEEAWLDIYLTSPIWRFALSSGLCGESPWTGVLMPSVDRVGRYFPLTLAVPLDDDSNLMRLLTDTNDWFLGAEELALSSLEDNFDIDAFDHSIQMLDAPQIPAGPEKLAPYRTNRPAWQFNLSNVSSSGAKMACCIDQTLISNLFPAYSLWWSQGSERITPSLLITEGLPPVSSFSSLLDGDWSKWGWGQYKLQQENNHDNNSEVMGLQPPG